MNDDCKVTDEQVEAAVRVLNAAGIDMTRLAEAIIEGAYALQTTLEAAAEIIRAAILPIVDHISEILEEVEKAGIFEEETNARRRRINRERLRLIEQRYKVQIRRYERAKHYRRIYKPP